MSIQDDQKARELGLLARDLRAGRVSRRVFIGRSMALGASALAASSILAACGGDDDDSSSSTTTAGSGTTGSTAAPGTSAPRTTAPTSSGEPIRLGVMPPLTGIVSAWGAEITWAAEIAVAEVNEAGGIMGREVVLEIEDDGSLPDTAVPAAERLIREKKCSAVIGNLLSNSRIAVSQQVTEPLKVPHLNFSFYEGSICGRYFFHYAALPNQQIDKMIPYMLEHFGPKMYFVGNDYEWPRGSIDAAKKALEAAGGEILGEEYFPLGTNDFAALLQRVGNAGPDVFVPFAAGSDQQALLKQFTAFGLKSEMETVMAHYDEAMMPGLEPDVRKDFYSSNTYFMTLDTPENAAYLDRLAKLSDVDGIWPDGNGILTNFGEGTYLSVHAFANAANAAGSIDSEDLVAALEQGSITGPQGEVVMDPVTHHAAVNTYLVKCTEEGTFPIVERFGRIDPVIPEIYAPCVANTI